VTFLVPVCVPCGHAVFPPRALCPKCGGREWTTTETAGAVEGLTLVDDVALVSVRTEAGPLVIARGSAGIKRGDRVGLEAEGAVPVAVPTDAPGA
jgi:uncharacterized OB-fold protein